MLEFLADNVYTVSTLAFMALVLALLFRDRKNVKRESGIFFLRRTQRGKKFLYRLGKSHPVFWKWLGNIAILAGIVGSIYMTFMLADQIYLTATGALPKEASGGILLPSLSGEAVFGRGFILVPFWYWIIALTMILVFHEGMHAMMGIIAKVRIKSIGWGALLVLPLGFVEPDEKQVEKKPTMQQLRFFAAGSFGNFILALLSLLVAIFLIAPFITTNGVYYGAVVQGYPAYQANLTGYIVGVNGYDINHTSDLEAALQAIGPGKEAHVRTVNGTQQLSFTLQTVPEPEQEFAPGPLTPLFAQVEMAAPGTIDLLEGPVDSWSSASYRLSEWEYLKESHPGLGTIADERIFVLTEELDEYPRGGFIGVAMTGNVARPDLTWQLYQLFYPWLFILNIGVGLFNLLPLKVLDGERIWRIILTRLAGKRIAEKAMNAVSLAVLFLIFAFFAVVLV